MAHEHPIYGNHDRDLKLRPDDPFVSRLMADVATDQIVMRNWLERRVHYYKRSYGEAWKKPVAPWVGSSDAVYNIGEMLVNESKPVIMSALFGGSAVTMMLPANNEAIEGAHQAQWTMETNIRHRMPRLKAETAYAIDSFHRFGLAIFKCGYRFETELVHETLRKNTLPNSLAKIIVVPAIDPQQQTELAQKFGVEVVTKDQFDANIGRIEDAVVQLYELDLTAKSDRKVLKQVVRLVRDGDAESEEILYRRATVHDEPTIESVPIDQFIVPPGTRHIQDAPRCTHEVYLTEEEVLMRKETEEWDKDAADALLMKGETVGATALPGLTNLLENARRERSGVIRAQLSRQKRFRVQEACTYRIVKGRPEKAIVTMSKEASVVMKAVPLPWHHRNWHFVVIDREYNEPGYGMSRGISEQIENEERTATALLRGELNNLLIETSRSFTLRKGSGLSIKNVRWAPGLILPVMRADDLQPIEMAPRSLALERPLALQVANAERKVGSPGIEKARDTRLFEPISATQSGNEERARQRLQSMPTMMFVEGFGEALGYSWSNWKQFGPKRFFALTTGGELQSVSQDEIRGDYFMMPVAAVGAHDPDVRKQEAIERFTVLMQAGEVLANDPTYAPNFAQAAKDVMDATDPMASARLLPRRPPEQIQQTVQGQQQRAQELQAVLAMGEQIAAGAPFTEQQAAQVLLEIARIAPPTGMVQLRQAAAQAEQTASRNTALTANAQAQPA